MGHEVLSNQEYRYFDQGYLVDNGPWQEKIRKRNEARLKPNISEPWPTLGTEEFQPAFLPENPEASGTFVTVEPTTEELLEKTRIEAEEKAKSIEQGAKKNAYEIVEKARWEANDLLNKAKEDAEKEIQLIKEAANEAGKKEGIERGHQEGFDQGRVEGQQSYSEVMKKWNGLLEVLTSERRKLLADLQPVLVELVGEALHHCLKKEAKRHGPMVLEFVQDVLKKAQDRVHLKLHLNPDDVEEVEIQREQLQLSVGAGGLEIFPDARIERGGCLLETEAGAVDGRLTTIVDQVKESLTNEMTKK